MPYRMGLRCYGQDVCFSLPIHSLDVFFLLFIFFLLSRHQHVKINDEDKFQPFGEFVWRMKIGIRSKTHVGYRSLSTIQVLKVTTRCLYLYIFCTNITKRSRYTYIHVQRISCSPISLSKTSCVCCFPSPYLQTSCPPSTIFHSLALAEILVNSLCQLPH